MSRGQAPFSCSSGQVRGEDVVAVLLGRLTQRIMPLMLTKAQMNCGHKASWRNGLELILALCVASSKNTWIS